MICGVLHDRNFEVDSLDPAEYRITGQNALGAQRLNRPVLSE
jgi:hypothetical protein